MISRGRSLSCGGSALTVKPRVSPFGCTGSGGMCGQLLRSGRRVGGRQESTIHRSFSARRAGRQVSGMSSAVVAAVSSDGNAMVRRVAADVGESVASGSSSVTHGLRLRLHSLRHAQRLPNFFSHDVYD